MWLVGGALPAPLTLSNKGCGAVQKTNPGVTVGDTHSVMDRVNIQAGGCHLSNCFVLHGYKFLKC